jgi:transposase
VIQLVAQMKILVARDPVDFRRGIDGLAAVCRQQFDRDPFSGCLFVFRNRSRTALKILAFDSHGFWLCHKRLSKGRLTWWPDGEPLAPMAAAELAVLISNGNPKRAAIPAPWRRLV